MSSALCFHFFRFVSIEILGNRLQYCVHSRFFEEAGDNIVSIRDSWKAVTMLIVNRDSWKAVTILYLFEILGTE